MDKKSNIFGAHGLQVALKGGRDLDFSFLSLNDLNKI
jgi:hypothetical protein